MRLWRHWPLWLLVALLPVMVGSWCDPIEYDTDAAVGDGGTTSDGGGTARHVTFTGQAAGEWGGGTIDGVVLTVGAYYGNLTAQIIDTFGAGQDLQLACGTLTVQPPESHSSFALVFNDGQGALLVDILDDEGQSFLAQAINTLTDAQAAGITSVDGIYKKLTADAASADRPIGALVIASCAGYVHEVSLE
ncbi:MAG: hypothetical protein HY906_14660 [Deltaproteobacteria bacterium]|nr:hypothetical protein [Deltaproteobacteria bacterium]